MTGPTLHQARVTLPGGKPRAVMLYVVLSDAPDDALTAVRKAAPAVSDVELVEHNLPAETAQRLELVPGHARSLA